jgi:hypothetical protein
MHGDTVRRLLTMIAMAGLFVGACDAKSPQGQPPTTSAASAKPSSRNEVDEPIPDPITHPCVVASAKFRVTLDKHSGSCTTAADCGCYPGGIDRRSGCGGVTDKATAERLQKIADDFHQMKCKLQAHCAAWQCAPKCSDGKCVQ